MAQISDDDIFGVADGSSEANPEGDPPTEIECLNKLGTRPVGTVRIAPQLVSPDAIICGDRCFLRRATGKYHEAVAVVAQSFQSHSKEGF